MKRLLLLFFLLPAVTVPQTVHDIPFASSGNVIELAIENTSQFPQSFVIVKVVGLPTWLKFEPQKTIIEHLAGGAEDRAKFTFSVDRTAPVNTTHALSFIILGNHGQIWTASVALKVSPPQFFELFQNYPNPFNPTTTISYQLSSPSKVHLVVYNLLGQEVTTLVDAVREAGFHHETWNASALSSGLYIYRITSTDESGHQNVQGKTMSLVK